jgi:hypothetical protein
MKFEDILNEDGRIVKGVNTTVDVGPNEIQTQAAKWGYDVTKDGFAPTLSSNGKEAPRYTAAEWAIIEGGHTLHEQESKPKLFDFDKY